MSNTQQARSIGQNADLTFKVNQHYGRHGWLRLTPAYSVKLVTGILTTCDHGLHVLDPFAGTATTLLCAAYAGNTGTGVEINPFLAWLGNAKLAWYSADSVSAASDAFSRLIRDATFTDSKAVIPPPMHNIRRWWDPEALDFLCKFKASLDDPTICEKSVRDLLLVTFCRLVIGFSNAAFNHQSMSFKDKTRANSSRKVQPLLFHAEHELAARARLEAQAVLESARDNPSGVARVVLGDSRCVSTVVSAKYDLLITSPPYPNRMSYIREVRPYMYWLGYLSDGREAGELDWSAIGGTWGIATSRLAEWQRSADGFYPPYLQTILSAIQKADRKSGHLLSNYVARYFEDMWRHIKDLANVLTTGATVHYIVGNSIFYDTLVPVERLFAEMLGEVGLRDVQIACLRKRNSKKELYEFDVTARR